MAIEYAVQCAAARDSDSEDASSPLAGAEREMGAFLRAVGRRLGPEAARRAANYWIEAFESSAGYCGRPGSVWRRITIAAASRLAQETVTPRFADTAA
jgi:hypothetical protein